MINQLIELSKSLEHSWELESFPNKAYELISQLDISISLEEFESEVSDWLSRLNELPLQLNLYNAFGEPPVTLYNNGKFAIDVYFWRKNNTAIHSHAFRGAFKVLFGKSLHEEFKVDFISEFDEGLSSSKLTTLKKTIMEAGSSQIILPGKELVHRVLHIDNPTISLCIRTVDDLQLSQWHHLQNGLSCKKINLDQLTIKKILYFQYLYMSDSNGGESFLNSCLDKLNSSTQISLYEGLCQNEFGMDYDISCAAVDILSSRFKKTDWFKLYEDHQQIINEDLIEYQASKGSLKLLAHSINCNYSFNETSQLLQSFENSDLKTLCQELLSEDLIFIEDHYEQQIQKITSFVNSETSSTGL